MFPPSWLLGVGVEFMETHRPGKPFQVVQEVHPPAPKPADMSTRPDSQTSVARELHPDTSESQIYLLCVSLGLH